MVRIIEHHHDAPGDEQVLELRVFKLQEGDVRGCVVPADLNVDHHMMEEMSAPVDQAFLDALALCETDDIEILWIHDPFGLFPPSDRPVQEI